MKKSEKFIGEQCYKDAKNQRRASEYLNRYSRMLSDKKIDKMKKEIKERKIEEREFRFDK